MLRLPEELRDIYMDNKEHILSSFFLSVFLSGLGSLCSHLYTLSLSSCLLSCFSLYSTTEE
ncbi:hypothetical protein BOTBODRAFT_425559 [Botryobasidium botryosum FD-172 SS1]|uniref:Uncharacterized protein n=1 Tax=Botryobasidium botryosum (strain FD-172 SS1) TaxID=930990 RepID=A0A067MKP4_BOTB1|nr:hypothetical protein BOTBODRAFT_425559 [Botryobasidium botryosum FD-172 SS1]